jgi:hypothetical protein
MSHGDPLDSFEAALFRAARRERTRSDALERTANAVVASHRLRRFQRVLLVFGGTVALAAGVALVLRSGPSANSIQAEPIAPKHSSFSVAAPPVSVVPSQPAVEPSAAAPDEAELLRGGLAPSVASTTREEEVVMLNGARAELAAGKPEAALSSLDRYDRVSGGHLTAEATLLRIQALSSSGRASLAEKLARRFVDSDPDGPLAEQARRYIPKASPSGSERTP